MSDDIIPIRPARVIDEAGGSVDELGITLAIYGDDLDPDEVSGRLACASTSAHRTGDRRGRSDLRYTAGAWLMTVRASPVREADALVELLLARLPVDAGFWAELHRDYTVQIRVSVHMDTWNRGFTFAAPTVRRLAATGAPVLFDIYCYEESE